MARISMTICDLCKEEIKEDDTEYSIVLSSCKDSKATARGTKVPADLNSGEICCNCHRSLLARLKKSPADLLRPINSQRSSGPFSETHLFSGRTAPSAPRDSVEDLFQLADGEFRVPSQAHTVPRAAEPECHHDKKSFGDDGKFICLSCNEVLGAA